MALTLSLPDPANQKKIEDFRIFEENPTTEEQRMVKQTYKEMHTKQCVQYVKNKHAEWCKFDHGEMTIMEALEKLSTFIDESDPDVDVPNLVHAYQTAERVRQKHPDKDWLIVVGLVHDLGKVMNFWGEPQFSTVGDTFPVGCQPSDEIVYGRKSFKDNPDFEDPVYSTKLGMYKEKAGLDNVCMSWGHDEYLYRVLKNHGATLPDEGMYAIRYHSFYPWHTSGAYMYLCSDRDLEMLQWVKEFNTFDLYSKSSDVPDVEALKPYYRDLVDKYIPGTVKW